ncbi:hypothetical protein H9P43_008315 [Blastocladiella emersonii ATCC 22665]|nr:hypothetical protein H9P43_008315 [Blastocladiella emersonii ATCC 22665]
MEPRHRKIYLDHPLRKHASVHGGGAGGALPFASRLLPRRPSLRLAVVVAALFLLARFFNPNSRHEDAGPAVVAAEADPAVVPSPVTKDTPRAYPPPIHHLRSTGPHAHAPAPRRAPADPRWSRYAVGVKSGVGVAATRIPAIHGAYLRGVERVMVLGDADVEDVGGTGLRMYDVVSDAVREALLSGAERYRGKGRRGKLGAKRRGEGMTAADLKAAGDAAARDLPPGPDFAGGKHDTAPAPAVAPVSTKDTDGWRNDANKFLPGLRALYDEHPDADWYILVDDDTYLAMENVHRALSPLDASHPHYFGAGASFAGCDGVTRFGDGPTFAHGGAGIFISRGAAERIDAILDVCILNYATCWVGDVRMALCMRDAGILFNDRVATNTTQFVTVPPTPDEFHYPDDACARPASFHHLSPAAVALMRAAEDAAHAAVQAHPEAFARASRDAAPHLYLPGDTDAAPAALDSVHYAPVVMADVWRAFVEPGEPLVRANTGRTGAAPMERDEAGTLAASLDECRARCHGDPARRCLVWEYDAQSRRCHRYATPGAKVVERKGSFSGMVPGRYVCRHRSL